jgi:proteasome assembly chaperone (PAC2) family protein
MDVIRQISEFPKLEDTLLIGAFEGWNDAAEAASSAVSTIIEQREAKLIAEIDPEEFFVFSDTRPNVRFVDDSYRREIVWPSNKIYAAPARNSFERPLLIIAGTEPDLKWRTFLDHLSTVVEQCNVTEVLMIGSMIAAVPHTRTVPLAGSSSDPTKLKMLREMGAPPSRYQGPTGVVGVFSTRCQEAGISSASVWGVAPSYLAARPNWKVALRLLNTVKKLHDLDLDLNALSEKAFMFEQRVNLAVADDPQIESYVKNLERQYDTGEGDEEDLDWSDSSPADDLPNASALIEKLEQELFGRKQEEDKD